MSQQQDRIGAASEVGKGTGSIRTSTPFSNLLNAGDVPVALYTTDFGRPVREC
jgi:hypothetical protein